LSGWNLKNLRDFVENTKTEKYCHLDRINSIDRAICIFIYHLNLAKEANDRVEPSDIREAMNLVLPSEEKMEDIWLEKIIIQANTQAALHSARAIHDIFAQLLNGLLLSDTIPIHSCDIAKVTRELSESKLKDYLTNLLVSEEFKYVNAIVNTIKHRNLVSFGAQISFRTGESGIQFREFKYRDVTYTALWAEDVLKHSLSVKNSVVTAGIMLNEYLGISEA